MKQHKVELAPHITSPSWCIQLQTNDTAHQKTIPLTTKLKMGIRLLQVNLVRLTPEEGLPQSRLKWGKRGRAGLKCLEELPHLQIKRSIVAAVTIEGMLRADGTALEQHSGSVKVTSQASVI